ncbi:MAG: PKD domain-containing protein [Patescibacteria group bacterium]|nr:PKD domain-containing protein [Patescibacteria group bacterium]
MRDYLKLKTWLILVVMLIIGIGSAILITYFEFKDKEGVARAEGGNNVAGYAWSENIGWISFNCSNNNSCLTVDYGVNIDPITGNFSGHAWSENIGWISFNRGDTGIPPAEPYAGAGETTIANYDSATGKITGWAKILVLGDDGWINFNVSDEGEMPLEFPLNFPVDFEEISFGVFLNSETGDFSGWAWNGGEEDGAGIGWISFNCADAGAGGCSGHSYKVYSSLNAPPQAQNPTAPNWTYAQACSLYARQAFLRWEFSDPDEGASQGAYQIIIDDDSDPGDPLVDTGKISEGASQYSAGPDILDYDQTYYWWVKVWDNTDISSSLVAGPPFTTYKHELPDVDFAWSPANPSENEEIKFSHSSVVYGGSTISSLLWIAPDSSIDDPATSTPTIIFSSPGSHPVTLRVTDSDGYYCSKTETIDVSVGLPSWKEVQPR